jgi:hypothetical protein
MAVEGPESEGPGSANYVWLETRDWPAWERKLIYGPYIHHVSGIYGNYKEVLREATRYMGLEFDSVD